ncbi:MAG: tyrosine-type recombinase/integrase, partial [Rhodospirillaceae bacterium]|nr:tyrosine-type recombinase/integrase [Rhodospirillaceae bacterium]
IDFEGREVRWRAEHEKTGYEHVTPLTDDAVAALKEARRMSDGSGNAPVLTSSRDATRCMGRATAQKWWKQAETLAGLEPKARRGWHSLRRKFASDLMDLPLKVLCELGGWKKPQTVLRCYQRPDAGQLRTALEGRRRARG